MKTRSLKWLFPVGAVLLCTAAVVPTLRKLSGHLARVALADVIDYQVSPDGKWAAYLADVDVDGTFELYSRELLPGARAVRLDPPDGNRLAVLGSLRITPDSSRLVYLSRKQINSLQSVYSVPLDGSAPTRELSPLVVGGGVQSFSLAAGDEVVFLADARVDEKTELFRVPVDGSQPPEAILATLG